VGGRRSKVANDLQIAEVTALAAAALLRNARSMNYPDGGGLDAADRPGLIEGSLAQHQA
jgi:hypothetical protein